VMNIVAPQHWHVALLALAVTDSSQEPE
jgi:hypothetical protein